MAVYRFEGDIGPDRRLEVPEAVPAGHVEVVLTQTPDKAARQNRLRSWLAAMNASPFRIRSRADIDESIRRERETWE